jgi:mannose-6-phosphate isomerase-like protein (cupin superfamily)
VLKFVFSRFKKLKRCAFLSLPVGQIVGTHIDEGTYYLTKDRYHLSIQGKYEYTVGDEKIMVEPGTFFWFNNKLSHSAKNIGEEPRITFVFDIPHHKKNL